MLKIIGFVATLMLLSQSYANKHGMAGCGLGSLVFEDQPGMIQIIAATLNGTSGNQTFGMTTGTSGCTHQSMASIQQSYIQSNIAALKADVVRGQGETLDGLVTLLGCNETASVKSELKNNYQQIFSQEQAPAVLKAIQNNSVVQKSCGTTRTT